MYVHVFSHYADVNSTIPYIAAGIVAGVVVASVLLIVAIVTTVAIVVCCKKCVLTKANRFKHLPPSTAAVDSNSVNATSTGVQEPQVEHEVREQCTKMCVY